MAEIVEKHTNAWDVVQGLLPLVAIAAALYAIYAWYSSNKTGSDAAPIWTNGGTPVNSGGSPVQSSAVGLYAPSQNGQNVVKSSSFLNSLWGNSSKDNLTYTYGQAGSLVAAGPGTPTNFYPYLGNRTSTSATLYTAKEQLDAVSYQGSRQNQANLVNSVNNWWSANDYVTVRTGTFGSNQTAKLPSGGVAAAQKALDVFNLINGTNLRVPVM